MNKLRHIITLVIWTLAVCGVHAADIMPDGVGERHTRFFNLVADEVRIDSMLPQVQFVLPLEEDYDDSVYVATILYPEFLDMGTRDIEDYRRVTGDAPLPELPEVTQTLLIERRRPSMLFSCTPLVHRDGRYQFLVSYMLKIESYKRSERRNAPRQASASNGERYAQHSVLAEGKWAKIGVKTSGVHQLSEEVIRRAGFKDISKVHVWGYGGNLQPERLTAEYLKDTDDLQEVPLCTVGGRRLFYAKGPVSWSDNNGSQRIRNPYSDYGCYFITESETPVPAITEDELKSLIKEAPESYYSLREIDNYAVFHGGRNLYEANAFDTSHPRTVTVSSPSEATQGTLIVSLMGLDSGTVNVSVNDEHVGIVDIKMVTYDKGHAAVGTFSVNNLKAENTITLTQASGGGTLIDYISICTPSATSMWLDDLSTANFPQAEYIYGISNQDHHADPQADMVIIIPTSQKLKEQAERLACFHRDSDGMKVNIVPADELYNEFSSGTPDATAYKRYLKMLYDRAKGVGTPPRYLLLFGDAVWDNRLKVVSSKTYNVNDLLLCYESENSCNEVNCFVSDDFFTMLDDNEVFGVNDRYVSQRDCAVGRIPATNAAQAEDVVVKCLKYAANGAAGKWKNTIVFMGDDGNENLHMRDVNAVADAISASYPGYNIRKIMWDAYQRVSSSTGATYPEVTQIIKAQQKEGALIMDYAGHGSATQLSHENVINIFDFDNFRGENLPLWVTASCDIMPFDGTETTIGETALLNPKGGCIAFFGTMRMVFAAYNKHINNAFLHFILADDEEGKPMTFGEAHRLAKNYVSTHEDPTVNKLQYTLLGDPALRITRPSAHCVVDSMTVNGTKYDMEENPKVSAGANLKVFGHVETANTAPNKFTDGIGLDYSKRPKPGLPLTDIQGVVSLQLRDSEEEIVCRDNPDEGERFVFKDRTKTLFNGSDSIRGGAYGITLVVPRDINYADKSGLLTLYVLSNDHTLEGHGENSSFILGGTTPQVNDSIGPSVYCYLNSPAFSNGGTVNATPFFYAEINDRDGINVSGTSIGHDLTLIIDDDYRQTYSLNNNFQFDFGSYTSGNTYYNIPRLSEGAHKLTFRAWDILNNPTTAVLQFYVDPGLSPNVVNINATHNPAKTYTTFVITHDHIGSELRAMVDILDMSGRHLHTIESSDTPMTATMFVDWDLHTSTGAALQTGVYLYRVRLSDNGAVTTSKAKKLVVVR